MCTLIGEAGINIANLMLGRDAKGGRALTVLNLDQPVPDDVLEKICAVPHVNEVRLVALPDAK
jgi:D-3-phosphoglycerate dehydrogenase